ncbi:hypothetical protein HK100_000128 [Physocladia obscura]|uniref:NADP-dependent oxidoreductase domain-containing protein n=1 Tax=Physocladia obscura TaxID=109957 RepID=A0AAD5T1E5_9FUNG|nr:hypothetical protein HK100_000128 [Physocladia obscura]
MDIPSIGLGTFRLRDASNAALVVDAALDVGYRLIDTAQVYANERCVGEAISRAKFRLGLTRKDVFLTTKDLVLIHWPGTSKRRLSLPNSENRLAAWAALEQLHSERKVRFIGVSNYAPLHLRELLASAPRVPPFINQIELHPLCFNAARETIAICHENNIKIQAYSSLGEGVLVDASIRDFDFMDEIVARYCGVSRAQLLLRWAVQHRFYVIPKASNEARLRENFNIMSFEISNQAEYKNSEQSGKQSKCRKKCINLYLVDKDMETLDSITTTGGFSHRKFCWDPSTVT